MSADKARRDLVLSFGSHVLFKLLGFVTLALLARQLSQADYGKLMFALSLCLTAVLVTDLGASTDLQRRVAASPFAARRRLGLVISARLPLLAVYYLIILAWVGLTKADALLIVAVIALHAIGKDLYRSYSLLFAGLQRIGLSIVAFTGGLLLLTAGVALGAVLDQGVRWMASCYVLGAAAMLMIAAAATRATIGRPRLLLPRPAVMKRVFGGSMFLFALAVMSLVHFSADTLMLGYMRPYNDVATYEAAAKLLEASQFLVRPLTLILFPICAQLAARGNWVDLHRLLHRMFLVVTGVGLVACAAMALLAGVLVRIVYTKTYDDSAMVLRVLYLSVPGLYVATVGAFLAASVHREKRAVAVMTAGVLLNVLANAWAIPRYGPLGAAWVTVVTQTLVAVCLVFEAYRAVSEHRALDAAAERDLEREVGATHE
ncbi:MAG: flippase [Phycisphaeraceae bacterium]|nr:flippase [Phycisphaeraceae bacterium]